MGADRSGTSCWIVSDRSATGSDTFDWAPRCSVGQLSAEVSGSYRASADNSAHPAAVVADRRWADLAAVDTGATVGSFCFAEERIDRDNPDRNCGCIDSDKGWVTGPADTRTAVESAVP